MPKWSKSLISRAREKLSDAVCTFLSPIDRQKWQNEKNRMDLKKKFSTVEKEFRKQLYTFITGALAFVAALFWRDALVDMAKQFVPQIDLWYFKLIMAIAVSLVAVVGILVIGKFMKMWAYGSR